MQNVFYIKNFLVFCKSSKEIPSTVSHDETFYTNILECEENLYHYGYVAISDNLQPDHALRLECHSYAPREYKFDCITTAMLKHGIEIYKEYERKI